MVVSNSTFTRGCFAPGNAPHKTNPKQMCILHPAFSFGIIHQSILLLLQLDGTSNLRPYLKKKTLMNDGVIVLRANDMIHNTVKCGILFLVSFTFPEEL